MASTFGVNYSVSIEAARPISVESITPIGVAGTASKMACGLHFFSSVSKARQALVTSKEGSLRMAMEAIDAQAVETPVVLSVFEVKQGENTEGPAINAVDDLVKAEAMFGYRVNLIAAPGFSQIKDVAAAMGKVAEKVKATAIVDIEAENLENAVARAAEISSKRMVICNPGVNSWDTVKNQAVTLPLSGFIAGMIARVDAEREYGFSDSCSNRVIGGISGTSRVVDFVLGEQCEADEMRKNGIATVIRYDGFRLWGAETTDAETIWKDLARVRTFDRIAEACQKGVFFAIDRKASQLYYAKRSVEELLRNLTGSEVLLGYSVSWSDNKNTEATVTQGKFYLDIKMQNNPIVKTIMLDFAYVDSYSGKLLANIND